MPDKDRLLNALLMNLANLIKEHTSRIHYHY
jgi:hypothetical protein